MRLTPVVAVAALALAAFTSWTPPARASAELKVVSASISDHTLTVSVRNVTTGMRVNGRVVADFNDGQGIQSQFRIVDLAPGASASVVMSFARGSVSPRTITDDITPFGAITPGTIRLGTITDDATPF